MSDAYVAAVVAAGLFVAMGAFQAVLALGAPLGAHVLGGRYAGSLPDRARWFSGIAAMILVGAAVVVAARAGVIGSPPSVADLLAPSTWVLTACLILNTAGNLAPKSRLKRTAFATTTATLAVRFADVALIGPGSTLHP